MASHFNTKLLKQLKKIVEYNPQLLQAKQLKWVNAYFEREDFLKTLRKRIKKEKLVGKDKSRVYSNSVIQYDKEHRMGGWA